MMESDTKRSSDLRHEEDAQGNDSKSTQNQASSTKSNLKNKSVFDSTKLIERSQSDAFLLNSDVNLHTMSTRTGSVDVIDPLKGESVPKQKISEISKVYFDLSRVEGEDTDDDDVVTPTSKNKPRKRSVCSQTNRLVISSTPDLQTIPADKEVELGTLAREVSEYDNIQQDVMTFESAPADLEHFPPYCRSVDLYSEDGMGSGSPSSSSSPANNLDSSDGLCFYTKYPLRFPHGYSLSKYRHNLKLSYQTLSQKLEQHIIQLRGLNLRGLLFLCSHDYNVH